jgi:hypothetical protein
VLPPSQGLAKRYEWEISLKGVAIPELPQSLVKAFKSDTLTSLEKGSSAQRGEPVSSSSLSNEDYIKSLYNYITGTLSYSEKNKEWGIKSVSSLEGSLKLIRKHLLFGEGQRENDLFNLANVLVKGGATFQQAMEVMTRVMFTCHDVDPDFIIKKIEGRMAYQKTQIASSASSVSNNTGACQIASSASSVSIQDKTREFVKYTQGSFTNDSMYRDLGIINGIDKTASRTVLGRMVKSGELERIGDKDGVYRKVKAGIKPMIWADADIRDYYPLKMPMGLHNEMAFYPKNIMVVAGAKSSGKTAFLMNMAWMNKTNHKDHKLRYLNSEMGPEELKKRVSMYEYPLGDWVKDIDFIERSSDFHDVIDPNGFNIIDFLEIGDNFYRIQGDIKKIHDKLDKGVCIIGLQKATGDHIETGRGGDFSKEKSRIYIALDRSKDVRDQYSLKIVDCKNPVHEAVTGKVIPYTLNSGTTFVSGEISDFKSQAP